MPKSTIVLDAARTVERFALDHTVRWNAPCSISHPEVLRMHRIAIVLGTVVPFSILGCLGSEWPPEPDPPEEQVGAAASEWFVVGPQPHGETAPDEQMDSAASEWCPVGPQRHGRTVPFFSQDARPRPEPLR